MSLRLVYGRAGCGKSRFCLQDIKTRMEEGGSQPLILIVPEQFSLQAERSLIQAIGQGGLMRAEVLSFKRLAYRVFSEVGGIAFPHMTPAAKSMILHRVLEQLRTELVFFAKAAMQRGFVNTLSDLITEFKRYCIAPGDLKEVLQQIPEQDLLRTKMSELCSIYQEYEDSILERYRDADDDLTLLPDKLDLSRQFEGAEVWIDEFSGFTPQEYAIIEKLLCKVRRVNISLCTDCLQDEPGVGDTDVFSPVKRAAGKLLRMAKDRGIAVEHPVAPSTDFLYRFKESAELAHLEKYFHAFPYSRYAGSHADNGDNGRTRDVQVFTSVNAYAEVEDTARGILGLCRDQGYRYRDIAVVTGSLETYEKLVRVIFSEYGIPYFIDSKRKLTDTPLVQLILSVFEIFNSHWSYEAVFRYLKTGLAGIEREDIDQIENYVLACGIRGSFWTQDKDWDYKTELTLDHGEGSREEAADEQLKSLNEIRRRIADPLQEFRARTRGRKRTVELCGALYEMLCSLGIPGQLERIMEELRNDGQLALAEEYSQVWNTVVEVLDRAAEAVGQEVLSLEKFGETLRIGLDQCTIGLIPPSLDQVSVGTVERSKNHEIKALYILGVNDGVFPAAGAQEGILSDADRDRLKAAGAEIAGDTRAKAFEEQFQVYSALTTPSRFLRLSYPIADYEGRTQRPSMVISRLRKLFPKLTESSNIAAGGASEPVELAAAGVSAFHGMMSAFREAMDGGALNPAWWDMYRWFARQEDWRGKCGKIRDALLYTNQAGPVDPGKVRKLFGGTMVSSVSQLEKYTACPFSYYVQYGLKAKERKIYRLMPPDVGTFIHTVIERFSRKVSEQGLSWRELEEAWCEAAISEIVEELLATMRGTALNGTERYRKLASRLKRMLQKSVELIAEHMKRGSFEPVGYEIEFGETGGFPPIVLELPSGDKISLTGRIDRIDALKTEHGSYLRIVDYKSGSKSFRLSDVYYGLQVQLITYLDAISAYGRADLPKPVLPGGILYFRIDDPIVKGNGSSSEEEVEKAILRQLKMQGLLLADVRLIREMDRDLEGSSLIVPARINKGDTLGKSSAASLGQFEALRKHVRRLLQSIGEEMMKGNMGIQPYKKRNVTSCMYCGYSSVCQFDPSLRDNKFKVLHDKPDEEIWDLIGPASSEVRNTAQPVGQQDEGGLKHE